MQLVIGPVLRFLGADPQAKTWRVSVLFVIEGEGNPALSWSTGAQAPIQAQAREIAAHCGRRVVVFEIAAPRDDLASAVEYGLGCAPQTWRFVVPARGERPRMAYASCNGFSSLKAMKSIDDKYALWRELLGRHSAAPYHLMLHGGDQVYADPMWESLPELEAWNESKSILADYLPMEPELAARVEGFYFDLYLRRWAQPELAAALASVPGVMMWDDHDIFDGWGSYPPVRQASPVFQGIFASARRWFRVFQLHLGELAPPEFLAPACGLTHAYRIDDLALLVLDLRSERCASHVMSPASWDAAFTWLEGQEGLRHVLVMTSIPLVYSDLDAVQDLLGYLPGQQELEDDLRDHWYSRAHQGERLRLIHRLLDLSRDRRARVTILSGDVHVAGLGLLEGTRPGDDGITIAQLISSGIVHPPPPAIVALALGNLMTELGELDRGITASMQALPGTRRRFLCARNWLSIEPDAAASWEQRRRLWVHWHVEGASEPYTMVLHPVPG
jgi:hypothetical protein